MDLDNIKCSHKIVACNRRWVEDIMSDTMGNGHCMLVALADPVNSQDMLKSLKPILNSETTFSKIVGFTGSIVAIGLQIDANARHMADRSSRARSENLESRQCIRF